MSWCPGAVEEGSLSPRPAKGHSHGGSAGLRLGVGRRLVGAVVALRTRADGPQGTHCSTEAGCGGRRGAVQPGTLACGDPLPGRGVALMSHLTGGPASHRQERRRPVPVSSEPAPLPAPQRGAHRCTPASSGGSSPEPAAPAPAPQPGTGRCLSPWPLGPGAAACWGCRWPLGAPSHTAPCSCSGRPPGGGAHSWGRERPGSAAPAMLPLGQRQGWGELAMPSHRRVDVAPHAN